MTKKALDEKYSYLIDEHNVVHLFRGEEDCQQLLTNPLISAIFKIEQLEVDLALSEHDREHNDYELTEVYEKMEGLEKENAELKEKNKWYSEQVCNKECAEVWENLTKAKELLKFWVDDFYDAFNNSKRYEERHKALEQSEQFLKKNEK